MKFLADENISKASINILTAHGYEVFRVDENLKGSEDSVLLKFAHENDYIVLTYDKDFGELIFKDFLNIPKGVVLYRLANDLPEDAGFLLINLIETENLTLENHFTVIEDNKIRQRKLL